MGGTGTHVHDLVAACTDHGAAGNTLNLNVQRVDVGIVTADRGVLDTGTAVLDDTDVGGGAADFEVDAVGSTQIHQSAHDGSGRAGQHGQNGALSHFVDAHNAAVAAHDHQGNVNTGSPDSTLGAVCGVHHLGEDGAVDGCGTGTAAQAVQLGDIGSHGSHDASGVGFLLDHHFVLDGVNAEGLGSGDDSGAFAHQLVNGSLDSFFADGILLLVCQIGVGGGDVASAVQQDVADPGLALGQHARDTAAAHAQDADLGHVAFDQSIGCLGGGVGNEDNIIGINVIFGQAVLEALDNAGGNTLLVIVGGLDDGFTDDLIGFVVQGHSLGVGTADVDADADLSVAHGKFLLL